MDARLAQLEALLADAGDDEDTMLAVGQTVADWLDASREADEPVMASARRAHAPTVQLSRVAASRPAHTQPRPTAPSGRTLITRPDGASIAEGDLMREVVSGLDLATRGLSGGRLIAQLHSGIAEGERIGRDAVRNEAIVASARRAITASGGICRPPEPYYPQQILATSDRPIRDALPILPALRGAVTLTAPPVFGDAASGTSVWTHANDVSPSNPATKPYITMPCADDEQTIYVSAITRSMKVGNFAARWEAERVESWLSLLLAEQASLAEETVISTITAASLAVSHGQVLGAARDIPAAVGQTVVQARSRGRMSPRETFTMVAPVWLREMMRLDLSRMAPGDGLLAVSDAQIDELFTVRGVRPVWSLDYQRFDATQGVGPVIGYPSVVDVLLFPVGGWLFLDGGTLDLGAVRDAALVGTNDALLFAEDFENVVHVAGPSYKLSIDACADGSTVAGGDIAVCVSGS
jgi:hypothetical protein